MSSACKPARSIASREARTANCEVYSPGGCFASLFNAGTTGNPVVRTSRPSLPAGHSSECLPDKSVLCPESRRAFVPSVPRWLYWWSVILSTTHWKSKHAQCYSRQAVCVTSHAARSFPQFLFRSVHPPGFRKTPWRCESRCGWPERSSCREQALQSFALQQRSAAMFE